MIRRLRFLLPGLLLLGTLTLYADPLREGFHHPPREFSQLAFWSWNGRLEPERLRWQIDQMIDKGIYGAFLHARAGINLDTTPYFSEGWWEAVEACVEYGARRDFATWLYDEDKWPSGAAGGRTIQTDPERNTRKGLKLHTMSVKGPAEVPLRIAQARYVVAGRLDSESGVDPASLVEITRHNDPVLHDVDPAPTRGLRVSVLSDWEQPLLAAYCRELGCAVTELRTAQALTVRLDQTDVLLSDVGTPGTTLPREMLLEWIRGGGGYIDFSHSEPGDSLYDVKMVIEEDVPGHRWLLPDHPIATTPHRDPDASYTGRRWSDQWWRGGRDFDAFQHVLADTRHEPPGISILAKEEGRGRVVLCGATQACREPGGHVELLQNLLVWVSGRETTVKPASRLSADEVPPWRCPEGDWVVIGYLPDTNPGTEAMPAVNYMNKDTVRDFIDITYEEYKRRVGEHFGTTIPGVFFDEIHNSGVEIVWVEGFEEEFHRLKGYDLIPLLPALTRDIGPRTPKVRCDYYDVYTKLYEEAWFAQIAGWCADHDLKLTGHTVEDLEAYRTQGSYFRTIRHLQIPGTDNEDFRYSYPRRIGAWKPKQLASISRLYGHPHAAVEAMGGAGWSFTLDSARYGFNLLAAHGINLFIPHLFHYAQDRPENVDDWPNSWFFRNPYWKYYKTFADHGSRLSYLLTGGRHVADVAVLYPITNLWAGHGGGSAQQTVENLVEAQIDCDVLDPASLLRATVAEGELRVAQSRYGVLVIPDLRCIRRDTAQRILEFLRSGGTVLLQKSWPTESMDHGRNDPELLQFRTEAEAAGVTPILVAETVDHVRAAIETDIVVRGVGRRALRYHHVSRDGREIYFLANDSRLRRSWVVSFRARGVPEVWNPEDGTTRPLSLYSAPPGRTECLVSLDGRQGVFIVLDTRRPAAPTGMVVSSTNLDDATVERMHARAFRLRGWLPSGIEEAEASGWIRERYSPLQQPFSATAQAGHDPGEVALDGRWSFLPVGGQLDHAWSIDVQTSELELPVMSVRWEHGQDGITAGWHRPGVQERPWRRIKVLDAFHADEGALRYRSRWQARFISWYDTGDFHTSTGGAGLACRKTVELPRGTQDGWVTVVTDGPFSLQVGKQAFRGDGGEPPQRFELETLQAGKLEIVVRTEEARAILVEGSVRVRGAPPVAIFTDGTWKVSLGTGGRDRAWHPAWEYVAPPEKPYGEPPYPEPGDPPTVAWYRQSLPPGTEAVLEPVIAGSWRAWVDGRPLEFDEGEAPIPGDLHAGMLVLRVEIAEGRNGLLEPVRVRCRPSQQEPGSWTEAHLDWYSGRAMYSTEFTLTEDHLQQGSRLRLELGKVLYCAEVWLNGKLIGTRVWPPYRVDITREARAGRNDLTVVVANLLANRMHWDIFDDVKGREWNRKWHDGNLLRDAWCFESGLMGPVRVVPLREVTLEVRS